MATRVRVPQVQGIRRSVEVKHGARGLGNMLRRGLHGSKNWVLELDEDGNHRSAWAKLARVAVVLLPVWIVMSAVTGGPERGGHSVGAFQSVVGALLVLLVGLAVFSARERRLGREEPWSDFPEDENSDTDGDEGDEEAPADSSSEADTEVAENAQVTELDSTENGEIDEDDSEISTEITQIERPDLQPTPQQATSEEPETVVIPASEAAPSVLPEAVQQAIEGSAKQENPDQTFDQIASVVDEFRQKDVQQASPEPSYSLVKDDSPVMQSKSRQANPEWTSLDVSTSTESDDGSIDDAPTTPLRPTVRTVLHEEGPATESPQVNLTKEAVQQPLQGTLQVQFATPGPYPTEDEPVHEGWWIVAPDVEPEAGSGETFQESPVQEPEPVAVSTSREPVAAPQGPSGRHHPIVLAYFASQAPKSGFTAEEKDQARSELISWLRGEISAEHLSRAEASRMLGVDPSTVTRWLSDDPWAG